MKDITNYESIPKKDTLEKRVLLYDDNQEILTVCKLILEKLQYQVKTLSRCDDVIEDTVEYQPDIILMDLWIPEIGGEKAIELLKGNPKTSHIPALLFSAHAEIKEISKRVKADYYITKPFNLLTLKETLEKFI